MTSINDLKKLYTTKGLDFTDAVNAWKRASYTTYDIKAQIQFDVNCTVDESVLNRIAGVTDTSYASYLTDKDHEIDALVEKKLAKLTPNIKKEMQRVGSNQFVIPKIASHVVWKVVSKDENGKTAFYLARVNESAADTTKKAAEEDLSGKKPDTSDIANKPMSEVLVEKVEIINGSVSLYPTNCPGKGKATDLITGPDGKYCCILQGSKCPHLLDFSMEPLAGEKTLRCDIK